MTVTKRGKPVVRVVPAGDEELEGMILHQDPDLASTEALWEAEG